MMKTTNNVVIEGYLFDLSDRFQKRVTGPTSKHPGTEYISGTFNVALDDEGCNVIPAFVRYKTAKTSTGGENRTFTVLNSLLDAKDTFVAVGKEKAIKLKVTGAIALNEFYAQDGSFVSQKVFDVSFVEIISNFSKERTNRFIADMYINNIVHIDADPEHFIETPYTAVRGCVFDYRGSLLPYEFHVYNEHGMKYFEDLEVSNANPLFTKIWGKVNNKTITRNRVEESAFSDPIVTYSESHQFEYIITNAAKNPYEFGEANVLTSDDIVAANQARAVVLAELKKRNEEKSTATPAPAVAPTAPISNPFGNIPAGNANAVSASFQNSFGNW